MKNFKNIVSQGFRDVFYIWWKELLSVLKDEGVVIFFILVPLGYPLLYTFIYTNETIHKVPIAVVDDSRTSLTREYIRTIGAGQNVEVKSICADLPEARDLMAREDIFGIVRIPSDFSHNLQTHRRAHVSAYFNLSGMLYYKAVMTSVVDASLEFNRDIKVSYAGNMTGEQDEVSAAPIQYEDVGLFNPTHGFASFLIPAVLMLIIQQTLLLGVGLSAGTAREKNSYFDLVPISRHYHGTARIVMGKSLVYLMIYTIMTVYIVCCVSRMFSLVQLSSPGTLFAFMFPYLLACIFFAMTCSVFIRNRETCMIIFVFTSVLLLFISGVSWPGSAIPAPWRLLSYIFPSTWGINGFMAINNMGASLSDVHTSYSALWVQTGIYALTTCIVYRRQIQISEKHAEFQENESGGRRPARL